MCNNAMVYNQPDTIYYKAAKRLLHAGLRILSPDKVRPLVPTISNFGELSAAHLGFEPLEESFRVFQSRQQQSQMVEGVDVEMETGFSSGGETVVETARDVFLKNESATSGGANNNFEVLPDDMTPDEILEQVLNHLNIACPFLNNMILIIEKKTSIYIFISMVMWLCGIWLCSFSCVFSNYLID